MLILGQHADVIASVNGTYLDRSLLTMPFAMFASVTAPDGRASPDKDDVTYKASCHDAQ